jgi:polyisoprenoid-binding protein YceI
MPKKSERDIMPERFMSRITTAAACLILVQSAASAGDLYKIDSEHTFSSFEYMHWGLSLQRGRFDLNSGMIELDMAAKAGTIDLDIDSGSVDTGSDQFNKVLRSDIFFDAAAYPKITFKSTGMQFDGDNLTQVSGDLTIKDVTRPVSFEITHFACRFMFIYLKPACGANGFAKILRSDFGLGRYAPFVGDDVSLYFSVEAIKE